MSRKNEGEVSSALGCTEAVGIAEFEKVLRILRANSEKPAEMPSGEESEAMLRTPPRRFDYHALHSTKEGEE